MGYGFAGHIGFAREAAFGTPVAATGYFEALSENFVLAKDRYDTKNIVAGYYEPDDAAGVNRLAGDIALSCHPDPLGHLLYQALGISSATAVLSGFLYANTFTSQQTDTGSDNALPSATYEIFRDVSSSQQLAGACISQLVLNCQPNQALRATASLIGRSMTNIAKTTPSFPGSPVEAFTFDTCSFSLGGLATTKIEGFTLTLNNQLQGIPALNNSANIARIRRGGPVMGTLGGTIAFDNLTEYLDFINQTERAVKIYFTKASSHSLLLDIPRIVYSAFPNGMGGRERLTVAFESKLRYHTGSANALSAVLTNTKSY